MAPAVALRTRDLVTGALALDMLHERRAVRRRHFVARLALMAHADDQCQH